MYLNKLRQLLGSKTYVSNFQGVVGDTWKNKISKIDFKDITVLILNIDFNFMILVLIS